MKYIGALLTAAFLLIAVRAYANEPMPPQVVLIVCKVILGQPDDNTSFTHHLDSEWDYANGQMHCKRLEVDLYDPSVDQGADPQPFTQMACNRAGVKLGAQFDVDNWNRNWRFWRHACPVPTIDTATGKILSWTLPPCPHKDGVIECIGDTAI
jgi:hypothetical protein